MKVPYKNVKVKMKVNELGEDERAYRGKDWKRDFNIYILFTAHLIIQVLRKQKLPFYENVNTNGMAERKRRKGDYRVFNF